MALAQRSLVSRTAARPCVIGRPVARRVLPVVRASLSEVTDASFADDVLNSSTPVLVDFWAPWCGPCRMVLPVLEELANDYKGKLKCVKMNIDESPQTASKYGVRSIPTVSFFKNGQKMDSITGVVPKTTLAMVTNKLL